MALLEVKINLERVADALERIAAVLETLIPAATAEQSAGEATVYTPANAWKAPPEREEWRNYGPPRRGSY